MQFLVAIMNNNNHGCTVYQVQNVKEAQQILKRLKAEGAIFPDFGQLILKNGSRKDVFLN